MYVLCVELQLDPEPGLTVKCQVAWLHRDLMQDKFLPVFPSVGDPVDEDSAQHQAGSPRKHSIPGPPVGEDGGSLYTHGLLGHPALPSQSESGVDSALSLLTSSSLSQGKGVNSPMVSLHCFYDHAALLTRGSVAVQDRLFRRLVSMSKLRVQSFERIIARGLRHLHLRHQTRRHAKTLMLHRKFLCAPVPKTR